MQDRPFVLDSALILCLLLVGMSTVAAPARAGQRVDRVALKNIELRERAAFRTAATRVDSVLRADGGARIVTDSSGMYREWIGVRRGRPILYQTHNREAAASARITTLHTEGNSGFNLNGSGRRIGLWDAGSPRLDHLEFGGRIIQHDPFALVHVHSTHVAGTLAASGAWIEARGMAPEANVDGHDWSDDIAEMAAAAADGLLVSSHSYGQPLGWTPNIQGDGYWGWMGDPSYSLTEDLRFGFYTEDALTWDEVAASAPEYLIVKSAGNERALEGPLDGEPHYIFDGGWRLSTDVRDRDGGESGYDTIGDAGVAKNVLTVGAVDDAPWGVQTPDDVVMTPFSSWGPVDDGRIKPDIVANGTDLLSTKSGTSNAYGTSSGTSMATPVVAGAVSLLQELYAREYGASTLSSTIRALIIHSADEAGLDPGPDYRFGWGHLNAERAARHIAQTALSDRSAAPMRPFQIYMIESSVAAGATYSVEVPVTNSGPLRVTLGWTDPAGQLLEWALNDRTPSLVHDLDLEIVGPDGLHLPWILNPDNPADAAARGTNTRDNIEQVVFQAEPGLYTVLVHAPQALTTPEQSFSLIIGEPETGANPSNTYAIAGTVRLGGLGIKNLNIRISGPVNRGSRTSDDGVFFSDGLPPGVYEVTPDPSWFEFDPSSIMVELPGPNPRLDLQAISPLEHVRTRIFESEFLLQSGEQSVAVDVTEAEAGGVYGVELFFSTSIGPDLQGASVILDTRFDPFVAPFSGESGNLFETASLDSKLLETGPFEMKKRVPVLWFAGDAPEGYQATIPYEVRSAQQDQLLYVDTLSVLISGPDRTAPLSFPSIRNSGLSYAAPGESMEIRAGFIDGSNITEARALLVDRFDPSTVLQELDLRDSGDLARDLDFVKGDGIFTGRFRPVSQAEYRLVVRAGDEYGNVQTRPLNAYFSSTPFDGGGDLLFLAESESWSRTEAHLETLRDLDLSTSWWENLTRGRISVDTANSFDVMIASRHGHPLQSEGDIQLLSEFLNAGGQLILLGHIPASGNAAHAWLRDRTGLTQLASQAQTGIVTGVGSMYGFVGSLEEGAFPSSLDLPDDALPLIVSGTRILAAKTGDVIVSTLSVASLSEPSAREGLLAGLFHAMTGESSYISLPANVAVQSANHIDATGDFVDLSWDDQSFSYFEIQLAFDDAFSISLTTAFSDGGSFVFGPLDRAQTYYWRIRGVNPAGNGSWSIARTIQSRPLNRTPIALSGPIQVDTGIGRDATIIDLQQLFSDPDNDSLVYEIALTPSGVVDYSLHEENLEITPVAPGSASMTIAATDPFTLSAQVVVALNVSANTAPTAPGWPDNPFYILPNQMRQWDLGDLFHDADGDSLRYWTFSPDSSIAIVSISASSMTISSKSVGKAFIAVSTNDGRGSFVDESLVVLVRTNETPIAATDFPRTDLLVGEQARLSLAPRFEDPDGDPLTYRILSFSDGVVDVSIEGDSLFASFLALGEAAILIEAADLFEQTATASLQLFVQSNAVLRTLDTELPLRFTVDPNYPQPFSSRTTIGFSLPSDVRVTLDIFDSIGRLQATIMDRDVVAGHHRIDWIPSALPAGTYYYRLRAGAKIHHGMLVYVR